MSPPKFRPPCHRCDQGAISCKDADPNCKKTTPEWREAFDKWVEVEVIPWAVVSNARMKMEIPGP